MSDLNFLLRLMNQQTSSEEAHMEYAAVLMLLGVLVLIAVALMLL